MGGLHNSIASFAERWIINMKKIYNIIPGSRIKDNSIVNRIFKLIDSVAFYNWIEINERVYSSNFFHFYDEFYVIYLDPNGLINHLYITCCQDIIKFMKAHINFEHGDGVDLAVCTKEICNAVICNHDGQIFVLKEENCRTIK